MGSRSLRMRWKTAWVGLLVFGLWGCASQVPSSGSSRGPRVACGGLRDLRKASEATVVVRLGSEGGSGALSVTRAPEAGGSSDSWIWVGEHGPSCHSSRPSGSFGVLLPFEGDFRVRVGTSLPVDVRVEDSSGGLIGRFRLSAPREEVRYVWAGRRSVTD